MDTIRTLRASLRSSLTLTSLLFLAFTFFQPAIGYGQVTTNVFTGVITLNGDISDFFEADGITPKRGVCVKDDPTALTAEAPVSRFITRSGANHPSAFNQRRIMSAYNPTLNGGTIFIGVDLPGGTGSAANPNYVGADGPTRMGLDGITAIRPFDADGNGEPETIGYDGATPFLRCIDILNPILTPADVIDCTVPESGGFTDAVNATLDPGNKERYGVTINFGDGTQVQMELYEDNTTPAGTAGVSLFSIPGGKTFGVTASRDGSGKPLGFDVEFALTNVNANVGECARLIQTVSVNSGSLQDGSPNGEDFNVLTCIYVLPVGIELTKVCPPTAPLPGQPLVFTGVVRNTGAVTLTNVTVVNDRPVPNTPVLTVASLAPGEARGFTNSYLVPANFTNCAITDTLTASATDICSNRVVTGTATATCPVLHTLMLTCPSNIVVQCLANVPPPNFAGGIATSTAGGVVVIHVGDTVVTNGCSFVITRTYRATDSCTNTLTCTQTIAVHDTTPPLITCPTNISVQCIGNVPPCPGSLAAFLALGGTASDNCDTNLTYFCSDGPLIGGICGGTIARTHTVVDDCTNSASCVQLIRVLDTIPPVITCPSNISVQCIGNVPACPGSLAAFRALGGAASDNCDTNLAYFCSDGPLIGGFCGGTIARTHTVVDDCTNSASCVQLIRVLDTTPPVITCPSNISVQCIGNVPACPGSLAAFLALGGTASDNCDTNLTYFCSDGPLIGGFCGGTIARTHTVVDDCTNSASCVQLIRVLDTIPPVITCPSNISVQCIGNVPACPGSLAAFLALGGTASDNCDTNLTYFCSDGPLVGGICGGTIARTHTVVDDCTNSASCVQLIRVADTIPPVLVGVPTNRFFQCLGDVPPPDNVTATDNCDTNVTVTIVTITNGSCPTFVIRTWTATDDCTNRTSASQTNIVLDTIPPVLVGVPTNMSVQCLADVPPPASVTATDNCDGAIPVTATYVTNGVCPTIITCTWRAQDRCTNSASATRTFTVNDTIPPVLTGVPTNMSVQCLGDVPPPANVTATDNCDGAIPVTATYATNGVCPTIITCTWRAQDHCTNSASATRTITVNDTIPPVLAGVPTNRTFQCLSDVPPPANVTATDNCDGAIPVTATYVTNGVCPTIITCTWRAQDRCTNSASATRTITIQPPPVTVASAPVDQLVCTNESASFCIQASQRCGVSYLWFRNGQPIPGATSNCLTIPVVSTADIGMYCVVVTGPCNSVTNCAQLTLKSSVGDFVWEDLNGNGCQDPNEPGISNVVVVLISCDTTTPIRTTVTDGTGHYLFNCVEPGNYRVRFIVPSSGYTFTTRTNPACAPTGDSDPAPDGITGCFTLPPGTIDLTVDAGVILCRPGIDLEKYVSRTVQGGEGLTPGFWKNHSRFGPAPLSGWPDTGYDPLDSYEAIFGVDVLGTPTLLQALGMNGGGVNALMRHSAAALLNASHPNIEYAFTVAQVIDMTRTAINSGNAGLIESTKDTFEDENQRGANLNTNTGGSGKPGVPQDADTPPGLQFAVGECPVFTYYVTNTGQCSLTNVMLVDDDATPNNPADDFNPEPKLSGIYNVGDTNHNGLLDPGEVWCYVGQTCITAPGQYCNLAVVIATPVDPNGHPIGAPITDRDPACWYVPPPCDARLVITLNCQGAAGVGQPISFSGVVSNAGGSVVTNVVVTHSIAGQVAAAGQLAPGDTLSFSGAFTPSSCGSNITSTVTATGRSTCNGARLSASATVSCSAPCPPPEPGGCRVTGGSNHETNVWQSACITTPLPSHISHGGQVGAPFSVGTPFTPNSPCISGEWEHNRHTRNGNHLVGTFHASGNGNEHQFDSLLCACLPCSDDPKAVGMVGELCNPGDRMCGPEPRRAPANKICFSGVGDYTFTQGKKTVKAVFRVDIEDRSEGNSHASTQPPDRYRIRLWILDPACGRNADPNSAEALAIRLAASADPAQIGSLATTESLKINITPDIDDGGDLIQGNHQIHPETGAQCTSSVAPQARLNVLAEIAPLASGGLGAFSAVASGVQSPADPTFVYRTTITNSGNAAITNLSVVRITGMTEEDVTSAYFAPNAAFVSGATITLYSTNSWSADTVRTILVAGKAQQGGVAVRSASTTVAGVSTNSQPLLSIRPSIKGYMIEWTAPVEARFLLETTTNLMAPNSWTNIPGATSPYIVPGKGAPSGTRYYRLRQP